MTQAKGAQTAPDDISALGFVPVRQAERLSSAPLVRLEQLMERLQRKNANNKAVKLALAADGSKENSDRMKRAVSGTSELIGELERLLRSWSGLVFSPQEAKFLKSIGFKADKKPTTLPGKGGVILPPTFKAAFPAIWVALYPTDLDALLFLPQGYGGYLRAFVPLNAD